MAYILRMPYLKSDVTCPSQTKSIAHLRINLTFTQVIMIVYEVIIPGKKVRTGLEERHQPWIKCHMLSWRKQLLVVPTTTC